MISCRGLLAVHDAGHRQKRSELMHELYSTCHFELNQDVWKKPCLEERKTSNFSFFRLHDDQLITIGMANRSGLSVVDLGSFKWV